MIQSDTIAAGSFIAIPKYAEIIDLSNASNLNNIYIIKQKKK